MEVCAFHSQEPSFISRRLAETTLRAFFVDICETELIIGSLFGNCCGDVWELANGGSTIRLGTELLEVFGETDRRM